MLASDSALKTKTEALGLRYAQTARTPHLLPILYNGASIRTHKMCGQCPILQLLLWHWPTVFDSPCVRQRNQVQTCPKPTNSLPCGLLECAAAARVRLSSLREAVAPPLTRITVRQRAVVSFLSPSSRLLGWMHGDRGCTQETRASTEKCKAHRSVGREHIADRLRLHEHQRAWKAQIPKAWAQASRWRR